MRTSQLIPFVKDCVQDVFDPTTARAITRNERGLRDFAHRINSLARGDQADIERGIAGIAQRLDGPSRRHLVRREKRPGMFLASFLA